MTWLRFVGAVVAVVPLLWLAVGVFYGRLLPAGMLQSVIIHVRLHYGDARFNAESVTLYHDAATLEADLRHRRAPRYAAWCKLVHARAEVLELVVHLLAWPWWASARMDATRIAIARLNKRLPKQRS